MLKNDNKEGKYMLKSSKYIYENDLYKIKNPTNIMIREIQDELVKYSGDTVDDIDFDNPKLNLWLLQYLVESDNVDYQFDKFTFADGAPFGILLE